MEPTSNIDQYAVAAVRGGDHAAFRDLVDRHAGKVFALVRTFVRDAERAEDLAQDTFLTAFARLQQYDESRAFGPWLLAIARNKCRDMLRRKSTAEVTTPDIESSSPAAAVVPTEAGVRSVLDRELALLPVEQRVAFVLMHCFDCSVADAAQIESVPIGTIKSRAARARAHLRSVFTKREAHHERA